VTAKLSQKLRHIRWLRGVRAKKVSSSQDNEHETVRKKCKLQKIKAQAATAGLLHLCGWLLCHYILCNCACGTGNWK